jgi:hypothetical protein
MSEHRFLFECRRPWSPECKVWGINRWPMISVHVRVEGPREIYVEGRYCPGANSAARRVFEAACRPFDSAGRDHVRLLAVGRLP